MVDKVEIKVEPENADDSMFSMEYSMEDTMPDDANADDSEQNDEAEEFLFVKSARQSRHTSKKRLKKQYKR